MNDEHQVPEQEKHELQVLMEWLGRYGKMAASVVAGVLVIVLVVLFVRSRAQAKTARAADLLFGAQTAQDLETVAEQYRGTPAAPLAALKLAKAQFDSGNLEAALAAYDDFLARYAAHDMAPAAELGRANCLEARGQFSEAKTIFEQFVESRPGHYLAADATFGIGRCLEQLGRPEEARAVYEDFLVERPDSPWAARAEDLLESMERRIAFTEREGSWAEPDSSMQPVMDGFQWPTMETPEEAEPVQVPDAVPVPEVEVQDSAGEEPAQPPVD